jgi:hypothetical protein
MEVGARLHTLATLPEKGPPVTIWQDLGWAPLLLLLLLLFRSYFTVLKEKNAEYALLNPFNADNLDVYCLHLSSEISTSSTTFF